jgi:hypothetical protein
MLKHLQLKPIKARLNPLRVSTSELQGWPGAGGGGVVSHIVKGNERTLNTGANISSRNKLFTHPH